MIKCHFVDVKTIHSTLSRSSFDESELERIADSILLANGLLCPLVLERTGVEEYQVIAGDREYYAAVIAKEKDIKQAEMVNAFVIEPNHKSAALAQIDLLTTSRSRSIRSAESIPDIDLLLTSISALLDRQLQPVLTQLERHERALSKLDSTPQSLAQPPLWGIEPAPVVVPEIVNLEPIPVPAPTTRKRANEPKNPKTKTTKKTAAKSKQTEVESAPNQSSELTIAEILPDTIQSPEPKNSEAKPAKTRTTEPKVTKTKSTATKQVKSVEVVPEPQPESSKPTPNPLAAVDPIKAIKTLDLIDRLDEDMLLRRMKQSGIPKADKLVPNIIAKRELQPNGKFDSWQQIAAAKISGLGEATIVKIIDKLK